MEEFIKFFKKFENEDKQAGCWLDLPDDESQIETENIDINGKDTEKRTNERANEWKSERKNRAEIHEWNIE